jgi:hypothetical protein
LRYCGGPTQIQSIVRALDKVTKNPRYYEMLRRTEGHREPIAAVAHDMGITVNNAYWVKHQALELLQRATLLAISEQRNAGAA